MKSSNPAVARKILVTGGSGFLGNYLIKELLRQGYDVTIATVDITDKKKVTDAVNGFDAVYHLAANLRTSETDKKDLHFAVNAQGTLNLLKACQLHGIKRFIFISTVAVYGDNPGEDVKESAPKSPADNYAVSKLLAETYCKEYAKKYGIIVTVIRSSYIYGHGQYAGRLFARLLDDAAKRKQTALQPLPGGYDFVYVKDVAAGIVTLGEKNQVKNFEDYNIAFGRFTTNQEIFEVVKSLTRCRYEIIETSSVPVKKVSFSIAKAKKAGYKPRFDLKSGLADYIKEMIKKT